LRKSLWRFLSKFALKQSSPETRVYQISHVLENDLTEKTVIAYNVISNSELDDDNIVPPLECFQYIMDVIQRIAPSKKVRLIVSHRNELIKRIEILCEGYLDQAIERFEKSKKGRR
jgi:hypothetical protein